MADQKITFHGMGPSANSSCTRAFLKAAGIDHEEVEAYGQTRTPEYVAKFPTNLAPAISHGDVHIAENLAIMRYCCKVFPEKAGKFIPADPAAAAKVDMICDYWSSFYPLVAKAMYPIVGFPLYAGDVAMMEETKEQTAKSQAAATADLEAMIKDKFVGVFLKDSKFLGGDELTIADFRMAPIFNFVRCAVNPLPEKVEAYLKNVEEAAPGYADAVKGVVAFASPKWKAAAAAEGGEAAAAAE